MCVSVSVCECVNVSLRVCVCLYVSGTATVILVFGGVRNEESCSDSGKYGSLSSNITHFMYNVCVSECVYMDVRMY